MKYYEMDHRGSLKESLKTLREITYDRFKFLLSYYNYKFYCFDDRIYSSRYIVPDIPKFCCKPYLLPCWLLKCEVENPIFHYENYFKEVFK